MSKPSHDKQISAWALDLMGFSREETSAHVKFLATLPQVEVHEVAQLLSQIRRSHAPKDAEAKRELARDILGGPFQGSRKNPAGFRKRSGQSHPL